MDESIWDWNQLLDFNIEDHLQLPMDDDDQDIMINNNLHASSSSNTYDLAGACPELDASSDKKQKSKTKMAFTMCQVPGCKADISELKGYHKRHRVCLTCSNASNVVIDGIHKRYCQQCGK
ncbi:squamosa promoter-binding-like protein 7 [Tanacetum coccineum]